MNVLLTTSLLTTLWSGLVLGISFVAQPAKFATPQLPRPIALATGRQMFRAMHLAESVLAISALLLSVAGAAPRLWPVFGAALMLLTQMIVLMPPLSARVDLRLAGKTPPASIWHALFGASEVAKLILLAIASLCPLLPVIHPLTYG
ncbi:MAG: DUF4149 domain-containing protein [Pseudomonadota bacterium]